MCFNAKNGLCVCARKLLFFFIKKLIFINIRIYFAWEKKNVKEQQQTKDKF